VKAFLRSFFNQFQVSTIIDFLPGSEKTKKEKKMKVLQNWNLCHGFAIRFAIIGEMVKCKKLVEYSIMFILPPGLVIQMTTALQLEGLVTKKPRKTPYTMAPQAVSVCQVINYAS
jgi:hypothetical protein